MLIRSTIALTITAGTLTTVSSADVVIQPTAITEVSSWRSCVPQINVINGSGLANTAIVATNAPIPAAWPAHVTGGCNNMWHTSCLDQVGTECEGGANADLTPYLIFDLGNLFDLTGIHLWNHNQVAPGGASETNRGIRNITVQVSSDGSNYSSAVPFNNVAQSPGSTAYAGIDLGLVAPAVRYVRINVLQNWGSTAVTGISEIRFKGNPQFGIVNSAVAPGTVELCGPQQVLITTRVVGLAAGQTATVSASGGPIPGASLALTDDGQNGDATAGDGLYSSTVTVPADYQLGDSQIGFAAQDSLGHTSSGSATLTVGTCVPTYTEQGDAGPLPELAASADGTGPLERIRGEFADGPDVDLFRITVCDASNFTASTMNGTTADTRLWLFNLDGTGVTFNDDAVGGGNALQSLITGQFLPGNGDYYLAVSRWTVAAVDSGGNDIWSAADDFRSENPPIPEQAGTTVAGWTGTSTATAPYTVALTGSCFYHPAPPACPADIGIAGGLPGQDGQLNNNDFISFIAYFFAQNPIADMGIAGGLPGSDGQWNNNDFIAFIAHFFAGCGT